VTHEPTWWSDRDSTGPLLNDAVYKAKTEYCLKNDMVVWRFHDHWHARKPDMELYGTLRALGFAPDDPKQCTGPQSVYTIPAITFVEYASKVRRQSDTPREAGGLMSDRRSLAGTSLAAETDAT
jgi:hypothetical protein